MRSRLRPKTETAPNCQYSEDQVVKHSELDGPSWARSRSSTCSSRYNGRSSYVGLGHGFGGSAASSCRRHVSKMRRRCASRWNGKRTAIQRWSRPGAPWGAVLTKVLEEDAGGTTTAQFLLRLEGSDLRCGWRVHPQPRRANRRTILPPPELVRACGSSRCDDPVIPFNLGNVLDELGFTREANRLSQAMARSPAMADASFNLGYPRKGTIGNETHLRAISGPSRSTRPMRTPSTTPPSCICAGASLRPLFNFWNKSGRRRARTPQKYDASRISAGLRPRQQRHANKLTRCRFRLRLRRYRI